MQINVLSIEEQSTLLLQVLTDPAKYQGMLAQLLARDSALAQRSKQLDAREKSIAARESRLEARLAKLLKD
jgi:hypothetical protein